MHRLSNHKIDKSENFIKFSSLRNGFLKKFIYKHHEIEAKKSLNYDFIEISTLLFMCLLLLRLLYSVTISDEDYTLLIYIGRNWHLLDANYVHNETLFILWTLNFVCIYVYVIQSPTKQYKWIEVYAFLKGILPHEKIGNYLFSFMRCFFLKFEFNF
jgi:hypothetical protein